MSSFWDSFTNAVEDFLRSLFSPIEAFVETFGNELIHVIVGTPYPNQVFSQPTNGAWGNIYDYYWEAIIPLSLSLYGLMLGLVIFFESTSSVFGGYTQAKLKRRAFTGLLGILSWWWICALSLRFVDALTGFIVPDLSEISLLESASFAVLGLLGILVAQSVDLTLFVLLALMYTVRQLGIYLFVLMMPLLIVFWIPGAGPFVLVSRFMTRLAGFYVPLLFMTVPTALLFRLGELLGNSFSLSLGGVGAWLLSLLVPVAALFAPFILFWQAGAFFIFTERTASHMSANRARRRVDRVHAGSTAAVHGGRNFSQGARGQPAVNRENQQLLDGSRSRAHRAGTHVDQTRTRLQETFERRRRGGGGGPSSGGNAGRTEQEADSERREQSEPLRKHDRSSQPAFPEPRDQDESTDDNQRHIQ